MHGPRRDERKPNEQCRSDCARDGALVADSRRPNWGKYALFAVCLVLLTLPLSTHESQFGFGVLAGGVDAAAADSGSVSGRFAGVRQALKKAPLPRKYKFHKIERAEAEDADESDDHDDASEEDKSAANMPVRPRRTADDSAEEKDGVRRGETENSRVNENEEYQFMRARKSRKEPRDEPSSEAAPRQQQKRQEDTESAEDNSATDSESATPSFFESIMAWIGGGAEETADAESSSAEAASKSNGIIEWLQQLIDSVAPVKAPKEPEPEPVGWLSYFNRWPFNIVFPIGQPEKPIRMPRHSSANTQQRKTARKGKDSVGAEDNNDQDKDEDEDDNDDDNDKDAAQAALTQEHFESLLHTLPSFVVSAAHVPGAKGHECRQQLQVFQQQMRAHKLWTLQMLDATAKLPSGLLRGHINQFGDFEQCMRVRTLIKEPPDMNMRVRGKYCLAHIETGTHEPALKLPVHLAHGRSLWNSHLGNPSHFVPRYGVANWGVCVPHQCPASVVQAMLQASLRPYNHTSGMELHVEVDEENDCYVQPIGSNNFGRLLKQNKKFAGAIGCFAVLAMLVLTAALQEAGPSIGSFFSRSRRASAETEVDTAEVEAHTPPTEVEVNEEAPEPGKAAPLSIQQLIIEMLRSFSPRRTANVLFSKQRNDVEFPLLHLIKLIATLMLYVCLKFLMIGHLPITDRDRLVRAVAQPFSVVFRAPLLYADTLLLISGFLAAYPMADEMAERTCIHLLKRVAGKVARTLPTVYVVLAFHTWVLPHLGAGPLWTNLVGQNAQMCEENLWRNLFSVQNAIDFEDTCSPMTIQLALEMQLFLLAPLLVWLFDVDAEAGFFLCGGLQAVSVGVRYARTNLEQLSVAHFHGMNVSKFYRTANLLYASPIARATPYLLGISAALLHRSQAGQLWPTAPVAVRRLGWCACAFTLFWCFWSPSAGMRANFIYSASEAAIYATWSPLLLGLALCWLLLMFPAALQTDQSVIGLLLRSRPLLFLSRIAFPTQLVTFVVVLYHTALAKEAVKFEYNNLLNFTEIGFILLVATGLAFLVDVPAQRIRHLLMERLFMEKAAVDLEPESEATSAAEPSEAAPTETEHPARPVIGDSNETTAACDTPEPPETIWASDAEEEEMKYITRRRSSTQQPDDVETVGDGSPVPEARAGSPLENYEDDEDFEVEEVEEVEEEEEELDEDELDISEEAEVMRRPESPLSESPPSADSASPINSRRRRPASDDSE